MTIKYDFIIIGAGAVGLAIARTLAKKNPSASIAVLEKNNSAGQETSRFNSGVIHSGLHLNPKSLKARFAREGKGRVVAFCKKNNIPHKKCGMLIVGAFPKLRDVSSMASQLLALLSLRLRASRQGVETRMLFGSQIKKLEPALKSFLSIHVPDVYIIDSVAFVSALESDVQKSKNVELVTDCPVDGVSRDGELYLVNGRERVFSAPVVINSAGLYAHEIAKMAGFEYQVYFYSGEYYKIISNKAEQAQGTLVYPALRPGSPGLGIHITKRPGGDVYLGPSAQAYNFPVFKEEDRTSPELFVDAVRSFWPELNSDDIEWSYVGVRPKVTSRGEGDFIINRDSSSPTMINLIGIESPGLTASLALGEYVAELAMGGEAG